MWNGEEEEDDKVCHTRAEYRAGNRERAVRVYTVNDESRCLMVRNVPALGCADDLIRLFAAHGPIHQHRMMDEEDAAPFTDVVWIKFAHINHARFAKRKLDDYPFMGSALEVSYLPGHEAMEDTWAKLEERRRIVAVRCRRLAEEQAGTQRDGRQDDGRADANHREAHGGMGDGAHAPTSASASASKSTSASAAAACAGTIPSLAPLPPARPPLRHRRISLPASLHSVNTHVRSSPSHISSPVSHISSSAIHVSSHLPVLSSIQRSPVVRSPSLSAWHRVQRRPRGMAMAAWTVLATPLWRTPALATPATTRPAAASSRAAARAPPALRSTRVFPPWTPPRLSCAPASLHCTHQLKPAWPRLLL
ncbi:hypothetical protein CLOM_g913 [Closterium sp. NIES-68]|nr:hypothetical protein CLOM_g913 [Closterium sp. NIES-68]GJP75365.1 hypothetical protein CLOP_g5820 [Closterium sp. NIES-67]